MANGRVREAVESILGSFSGLKDIKELFSELNYETARGTISRRGWSSKLAKDSLAEDPQIIATHEDFHIIYGKLASDKLTLTAQRAVVNTMLQQHPYALFVFSTEDEKSWHFVNVKLASGQDDEINKDAKKRRLFRRITVHQKEKRLRTAVDRLSLLNLAMIQPELFGIPPLTIQAQHDEAFDVEAVTKEFYIAYENIFKILWAELEHKTGDHMWAHDYSLQFLNRVMFLYFVQRKGWLGNDSDFLETFWKAYNRSDEPADTFFDKWLKVLFFEAFNDCKNLLNTAERAYLPEQIRQILWEAPFLNGGLFKENKLDSKNDLSISDKRFKQIFNFFQQYNFTITEDSPLDQEVAVDPEMIGKVYEGLVNVSDTTSERGDAGIFYTPRTEIDLMCRLTLVDQFTNHLGDKHKNLFYRAIFALEQEEKDDADTELAKAGIWPDLEKRLHEITVLDPACGSGSFLVGMLYVLNDLLTRVQRQQGKERDSYQRKKDIIGQSLYGVDVMDWACHVAELRLWLALIVDADFTKEELMIRKEPLLPHFSFKIRCGDSLVQEVGGVDMAHRRGVMELSKNMKRRLRELKNEKAKYYSNDITCNYKTVDALESQEVLIFRDLLKDRINTIDSEAKKLMRLQAEKGARQRSLLTGELEGPAEQFTLEHEKRERQIQALMEEKKRVETVLDNLRDKTTVPFVWDISFAEIFSGDSHGFDIVIGNPPYVRQEKIADPRLTEDEITTENKKAYKAKLARSVYKKYPAFFGYKQTSKGETVAHKINAKSDLYIYFYFHALSLLNEKGSFCFITSNSWLDVGYGKDLQEFLLKRCHAKLVIDNKAKRSFKEADINTVIVLFGSPVDPKTSDEMSLENTAKFVMFSVSFEEALHPIVFEEIEEARQKTTVHEYRVFPIKQKKLLEDGCEIPKETEKEKSRGPLIKTAKYIGNKWGGKYLRAPDIYFKIMHKKNLMCSFGSLASHIQRNNMQQLRNTTFTLKAECPNGFPFLHSVKDVDCIKIEPTRLPKVIPTKGQKNARWLVPDVISNRFIGARLCFFEGGDFIVNDSFFIATLKKKYRKKIVLALMNSTLSLMILELLGRKNLGAGVLCVYGPELSEHQILKPELLSESQIKNLEKSYNSMSKRTILPIFDEIKMSDRHSIDEIVFTVLGLTNSEKNAVYEAVIDLVEARLKKAESFKVQKERKKRFNAVNQTLGIWSGMPTDFIHEDEED